jgi:3-carboxy-cis,cis-muconate cycloisomerase
LSFPESDVGLLSPVRVGSPAEVATGDLAFLQAMLDAEAALTRAQVTLGFAPKEAADAVGAVAEAGRFDLRDLALRSRAGGNPVIPLVTDLTAAVGAEFGPYVHRGATSQDILDTSAMLVALRTLTLIIADLDRTITVLGTLAVEHRDTPMPGRTLTQHAVPTTFGLKSAGWRSLVLDARDRLATVRRALPVQLGGAAGTLAAFHAYAPPPADPDMGVRLSAEFANEMGLAAPLLPWHTLRTPIADLGAVLAFTTGALGKLAADVLVLGRTELAEVAEGTGGGSSAMPHKSNPVRATLLAATARQVPALASILLGSLVAEDERPAGAWHAEWQTLREALRLTGGAAHTATELVANLVVHPDRMRADLDLTHGLIVSERVGIELTPRLGRTEARAVLDRASKQAVTEEIPLSQALGDDSVDTDPTTYLGSAAALVDAALQRKAAG